jgi:hypothetical protein
MAAICAFSGFELCGKSKENITAELGGKNPVRSAGDAYYSREKFAGLHRAKPDTSEADDDVADHDR